MLNQSHSVLKLLSKILNDERSSQCFSVHISIGLTAQEVKYFNLKSIPMHLLFNFFLIKYLEVNLKTHWLEVITLHFPILNSANFTLYIPINSKEISLWSCRIASQVIEYKSSLYLRTQCQISLKSSLVYSDWLAPKLFEDPIIVVLELCFKTWLGQKPI